MSTRGDHEFDADIRWTTHGVAHIAARNWGSLGFGQGYAMAADHLPTIADQIIKVRSERARFHGAGTGDANLASDLGYLALGVRDRAPQLQAAQTPRLRELVRGYAAGYNAWLAEATAQGGLPAWCADAPWIRRIDELDLWTYYVDISIMASGRNLAEIIGRAEAPGPDGPAPASPVSALGEPDAASNGWAFGGDATASGHGLVVANPHFPWGGEARFWENHLTIPGEIDCYGVTLLGTPGIQMGFNDAVAWAHTFSRGHRFTLQQLDLADDDPTAYRYGDERRAMTSREHHVDVLGSDGSIDRVSRDLWRSHHGPMVNLPLLGWGMETSFSYRDANLDNNHVVGQFLGMATAGSMDEFQAVFTDVAGMPWVNTLAADRTGRAWYIDASSTPQLSDDAQARYRARVATDPVAALLLESRVALLNGSEPDDEWVSSPNGRQPGLIPVEDMPQLERRDYVINANDSHWLTHLEDALEGYSPLNGFEGTARSLRTRQNLRAAIDLSASGDLTLERALAVLFSNDSLSATLLRPEVIARLRADQSGTEDLGRVAAVLEAWDGRFDLSSVGAVLWREFMAGFEAAAYLAAGPLFAEPFDLAAPATTPSGLAPAPAGGADPVVEAATAALAVLAEAGVDIEAPLGDVQWVQRGDHRVPVHGGTECDGVLNILSPLGALASQSLEPGPEPLAPIPGRTARTGLRVGGYRCTYGTSFVMAVEMTASGPIGVGLLAYGQSGDADSEHHVDGTRAYAAKQTRPLRFTDADIEADPELARRTVTG